MNLFEKIAEVLKSHDELNSLKEALGFTSSDATADIVSQVKASSDSLDSAITPAAPVDPAPVEQPVAE